MGTLSPKEGIIYYYLFQKKFSNYLNNKKSEKDEFKFQNVYLIHPDYMEDFLGIINYTEIENYLNNNNINEKNVEINTAHIINYLNEKISQEIETIVFGIQKTYSFNIDKQRIFDKRILAGVMPNEIYKALKISEKNQKIKIKFLFKKVMIIFVIEELKKFKIIITDTSKYFPTEEVVNITWENYDNEAYKINFEFLEKAESESILEYFNIKQILNMPKIEKYKDGKKVHVLINENLYQEILNIKKPENIDFQSAKKISFKGLDNLGDKYNINSCLQCLANIKPITDYLLNNKNYTDIFNNKSLCPLTLQYCQVLIKLFCEKLNDDSYSHKIFKKSLDKIILDTKDIKINDTKDFILFLINVMNSELTNLHKEKNNIKKNEIASNINIFDEKTVLSNFLNKFQNTHASIMGENLFGFQKIIHNCQNCKKKTFNIKLFNILIFNLEEIAKFCNLNDESIIKPVINFGQCFSYLGRKQFLQNINCPACRTQANAIYEEVLYSLPNYLIIKLNRGKEKDFKFDIKIPEIFDISNLEENMKNKKYELIGIISHLGPNENEEESIAFCKHSLDNKWRSYKDNDVTECQNDYLTKGIPYILFYKNNDNIIINNSQLQFEEIFVNQNNNSTNNINYMYDTNYNKNGNFFQNMSFINNTNLSNYYQNNMTMPNFYNINNNNK